jgi:signal transduction histidine kinase
MSQGGTFINPPPKTAAVDPAVPSPDANLQIFARSLAHDFNNLITGILGHAALIEEVASTDDTGIAESAAIIRKTAERAAELNAQLMNLSGNVAPRTVPFDVHETIREVASLVTPSFANRVRIHLELRATAAHLTGDPGQLHQVLLNLAVNARDAMPHGGNLTFATDDSSAGFFSLWVSDTGDGIPIELHERIFVPLFTTKTEGKGTGLGLAVVKRVVEQHFGTIELRSSPGFGTTFHLRFPVREPVEQPILAGAACLGGS